MNIIEKARNQMELMEAYKQAISAVDGCKDSYWYNRNKQELAEEMAKDESERNESNIEYLRNEIEESERKNAYYDIIEGQLLELMMGKTIK